jgi:probable phosphoglycerate mutase
MKLTVVRHGETTHNAKKIVMGQKHGNLSALGKKQVRALGKELKKYKFDFIYCSDLKRCKDTLKEIAKYHKHIPVIFTPELRERNMGIYEGRPRVDLDKAFQKYRGSSVHFKPKEFLNYLAKNHQEDRLLIVTHGGVLRVVAAILQKISIPKLFKTITFHNTAISEYEVWGKSIKVIKFNDIVHLEK